MKKISLIFLTVTLISGCQKQPETTNGNGFEDKKFEEADAKLSSYLDTLDNPKADKKDQKKILCIEYPNVYKHEYLPALLKLTDAEPKEKLLNDLKLTTDYYSEKLGIVCE